MIINQADLIIVSPENSGQAVCSHCLPLSIHLSLCAQTANVPIFIPREANTLINLYDSYNSWINKALHSVLVHIM